MFGDDYKISVLRIKISLHYYFGGDVNMRIFFPKGLPEITIIYKIY